MAGETYRFVDDEPQGYKFVDEPVDPRKAIVADMKARPFGSGIPKLAYDLGGKATDLATNLGASPEVAGGVGYGANVLTQAIPSLLSAFGAQKAAAPVMQAAGKSLMKSAIKPTIADLRSGDAAKAIDTMLKEGFNPTKGGVEAMQAQIAKLGDQVSDAVAGSNAMINKNAVAGRLQDALKKFSMQVNPSSDAKAIEKAWTEFLEHPLLAGRPDMTVQTAQALKEGTYSSLGKKAYGELKGADIEAQKALARGLKEEISTAVPEVAALNARQSALINAKEIAERRALMEGNKNPAGLALLANNPMAGVGFMADRSALLKSLLARLLYSGSETVPAAAGGAGMALGMQPRGALYREE
jgi:hypothetical protein